MSDTTKRAEWRKMVRVSPGVVPLEDFNKPVKPPGRPRRLTDEERRERTKAANRAWREKELLRRKETEAATGSVRKGPGPRRMPLDGRVFGELTVVEYADTIGEAGCRKARWRLRCSCGVVVVLRTDQLMAKYGRKHCGHARGRKFTPTEPQAGDRPKRGGRGLLQTPGARRQWGRKEHTAPRESSAAEVEEQALQAAEKIANRKLRQENEARARRGERWIPAPVKELDAAGWIRLLRTMRRAGARWSELSMEMESAAAFGVTREMVEEDT